MRLIVLFLLIVPICCSQTVFVGAIAGGRLTDDVAGSARPESRRYIVGPMIELGLPLGFGVEFEATYHRHGYSADGFNMAQFQIDRERANSWEFPILLRYKLPVPTVRPFLEVGVAPRTISGTISTTFTASDVITGQTTISNSTAATHWDTSIGFVAGVGLQFGVGRLRLSPEGRYTHWNNRPVNGVILDNPPFYSTRNQFDVLVGIGWRLR
jgi:hypothetical protein